MEKKKAWKVFYIEGVGDNLVSRETNIFAHTREGARKKIDNGNRLVTAIESVKPVRQKIVAICGVFDGCRCTICGGFFGEDDNICASGHQIGQKYNRRRS